jgi:hypothetical protein
MFISYRREETAPYARRLRDRLVQEFGQDQIFMDIDTIDPGVDFVHAIEETVSAVDVLVCVMGNEWSAITDASGNRRLEDPRDFVRLEVVSALKRDIRVVPVLVRGATMLSADQLPPDLSTLARRNALPLDDARFHADMDRLIESIRKSLPETCPRQEVPSPEIRRNAGVHWRKLRGFRQLADVIAGVKFIDGVDETKISGKAA